MQKIERFLLILACLACMLAGSIGVASADPVICDMTKFSQCDPGTPLDPNIATLTFTIDERGVDEPIHVTYKDGSTADAVVHSTTRPADPGPWPAGQQVLAYVLPVPGGVSDGWLYVIDADSTGPNDPKDVIHFHGGTMCFYSDRAGEIEPEAQRSDIGIPFSTVDPAVVRVNEQSDAVANYSANDGSVEDFPRVPTLGTADYTIISDVPEPASKFLLGSLLVGLASAVRKRLE